MNEKNIYLKFLIENVRKNDESSLKKVINLFEKYIRMLSKDKGTYIYDELIEELLVLILLINLEKENLFGYIKVCLKNYYIKLINEQNKKVGIEELQNIIFCERDNIDRVDKEEKIDAYLNNIELFEELLPKCIKEDEKILLIKYYINHKSISELMKMTSKKKSTIYMKLRSCRNIVENYILKEVSL